MHGFRICSRSVRLKQNRKCGLLRFGVVAREDGTSAIKNHLGKRSIAFREIENIG